MICMMFVAFMILFISYFMMFLSMVLSKKSFYDREKNSPFECGFDPRSSSRMPFSLRFFMITIIFLIFDVEIVLLIPSVLIMKTCNVMWWTITLFFFMVILLAGLYHEWKQGALTWAY